MNNDLAPDELAARYQLLCRSTQAEAAKDPQAQQVEMHFQALNQLLQHDLRALARRGSPDDVADIYFALEQELERFREFCSFPALAEKFLVAFGGGFSAGKSSLINTLLGKRLLAIEVDPTTSLPTYLLKGEHDAIHAHNLFGHRIDLSTEEFLSLTHDEIERYGSNISRLLRSVVITRADFPWSNLALIDTPGYTKHEDQTQGARTDESIARTQLNAAQAIVWVIDARQGCITENDLQFLASVQADIPRLIVVSRADQKPTEEINAIVQGIKATLSEHDLPFVDVIPVSAHQKQEWSIEPIRTQLAAWSRQPRALRFAQNLKAQFTRYANFIEEEQCQMQRHLNRLNRILVLTESQDVQADAAELKWQAEYSLTAAKDRATELLGLSQRFFNEIKAIADAVGIARGQLLECNLQVDVALREAEAAAVTEIIMLNDSNLPTVYATAGAFSARLLLNHVINKSLNKNNIGATSHGGAVYTPVLGNINSRTKAALAFLAESRSFKMLGQRIRLLLENSSDTFQMCGEQVRALDAKMTVAFNRVMHRQLSIGKDVYIESFAGDIDKILDIFNASEVYKAIPQALKLVEREFIARNTHTLSGVFRDAALRNIEELLLPDPALTDEVKDGLMLFARPVISVLLAICADELSIDIDVGQTRALIASEHRQLATFASTLVDMINPITDTGSDITVVTLEGYSFELDKGLLGDPYYLVTRTR